MHIRGPTQTYWVRNWGVRPGRVQLRKPSRWFWGCSWGRTIILELRFPTLAASKNQLGTHLKSPCLGPLTDQFISIWGWNLGKRDIFFHNFLGDSQMCQGWEQVVNAKEVQGVLLLRWTQHLGRHLESLFGLSSQISAGESRNLYFKQAPRATVVISALRPILTPVFGVKSVNHQFHPIYFTSGD